MSIADMIRRMVEAGAPSEAIVVAVEAVEEMQARDAERRAIGAEKSARYRARGGGNIPEELRRAVFERDGFRCVYCGAGDHLQCDHVEPVSKGGATTFENLATACQVCNARKRDRDRKRAVRGHSEDKPGPSGDGSHPPSPRKDNQNPSPPLPPINQGSDAGAGTRAGFPSWPSDAWEQFIDRYPNRRKLGGPRGGKAAFGLVAMRWSHRLRFEDLLAGVDRYVASKPADENWMLPGTWLEDERWTDEAAPVVARKPGREAGIVTVMRHCQELAAAELEQGGSHVQRDRQQRPVTRPYSACRPPDGAMDRYLAKRSGRVA